MRFLHPTGFLLSDTTIWCFFIGLSWSGWIDQIHRFHNKTVGMRFLYLTGLFLQLLRLSSQPAWKTLGWFTWLSLGKTYASHRSPAHWSPMDTIWIICLQGATDLLETACSARKAFSGYAPTGSKVGCMTTFKCGGTTWLQSYIIEVL
jgi:hypothetical protein